METCLFCRIVRGEIPTEKVAESPDCLAFRDIAPQSPVHVLIIPKVHLGSLNDLTDGAILGAMGLMAKQVAAAEGIAESGYRCVMNTGDDGGQTVAHLHMHVVGGRRHRWPPG